MLKSPEDKNRIALFVTQWIFAALLITLLAMNSQVIGLGGDWQLTYGHLKANWLNPYQPSLLTNPNPFTNPPWLIFLFPQVLLPLSVGSLVNRAITIILIVLVIQKYKAGWRDLIIVATSLPFLDIIWNNNVDAVLFLAILLPSQYKSYGIPILLLKPQVISSIALIWWRQFKFKPHFFLPLIAVFLLSFLIWGIWPAQLPGVKNATEVPWNVSIWPYGIPVGLGLLFFAYKQPDQDFTAEVLAAISTCFLVPYLASYSLIVPFTLLAVRYKTISILVSVLFWVYFITVGIILL